MIHWECNECRQEFLNLILQRLCRGTPFTSPIMYVTWKHHFNMSAVYYCCYCWTTTLLRIFCFFCFIDSIAVITYMLLTIITAFTNRHVLTVIMWLLHYSVITSIVQIPFHYYYYTSSLSLTWSCFYDIFIANVEPFLNLSDPAIKY